VSLDSAVVDLKKKIVLLYSTGLCQLLSAVVFNWPLSVVADTDGDGTFYSHWTMHGRTDQKAFKIRFGLSAIKLEKYCKQY
jgi:hypothetical protein